MAINISLNAANAASVKLECKAFDAIQRDRFAATSVQTTGNVYVCNKYRPASEITEGEWIQIPATTPGLVVVSFPVAWITADANFSVCSFCEGNS
jgi:hypothetical protein